MLGGMSMAPWSSMSNEAFPFVDRATLLSVVE
jgi:hypothetical protein